MLSKQGLRASGDDHYPFDAVRASLDGLIHFVANGFGPEFFPPGPLPYKMDPASIWLLFRGPHTCFTHHDLNRKDIQDDFQRRFANWNEMVKGQRGPVTFLRTSIAENPFMEAGLIPMLEEALVAKSGNKLDFRTVLIVHDQGGETRQVAAPTERSAVWNLALDTSVPPSASLFDKTEVGYRTIIEAVGSPDSWGSGRPLSQAPVDCETVNTTLCTVEGVPAMTGSCKGIGTTATAAVGRCVFCGSADGHAVDPALFDTNKPWNEEDEAMLLAAFTASGDVVASCEAVSAQQGRSANEVLQRLTRLLKENKSPT